MDLWYGALNYQIEHHLCFAIIMWYGTMVSSCAMKSRIDKAGRLVLPKPVRDELGLVAGQEIDVRVEDGRAVLEPAVVTWHVERRGRLSVLVPDGPVPQLTDAEVLDALERGRNPEARQLDTC